MGFSQDACFDICKKKYGSNFFENNLFFFFFFKRGRCFEPKMHFLQKIDFLTFLRKNKYFLKNLTPYIFSFIYYLCLKKKLGL